ncbi:type I-C CRISPR-associated protein Cas8c/Csd1 [bacterium]|nr:type I-C CRISPR-associated protein Cas8c/Csd1 [bacterium]
MILQALYALAQRENLVADPDFEPKPLCWVIEVNPEGRLIKIHDWRQAPTVEAADSKRKRSIKPKPKPYPLPREGARTSGDRAFLLHDKAEYIFGIDPAAGFKPGRRSKDRCALFKQRVADCYAATQDEAIGAILKLLEDLESGQQTVELAHDVGTSDLFGFLYTPDVEILVTDRPAFREYWHAQRGDGVQSNGYTHECLITGEPCVPVDLFPGTKRVPGGTTSGVSLVSFNASAFDSQGWKSGANAPISRPAAEACGTALNRLMDPAYPDPMEQGVTLPRRNLRLSADTVVAYWAADSGDDHLCSSFGALFEVHPEEVEEMYRSIWNGKPPLIENPSAFYALVLSGSQGRAIVRGWIETTVSRVLARLARWFDDLTIVRNAPLPKNGHHPPAFSMRSLLESIAPLGDSSQIPANLTAALARSALEGLPLPETVLARAVERHRAEMGQDDWPALQRKDARAALLKAVFRRNSQHIHLKEIKPEMNPMDNQMQDRPGYLLGKLMAVLERLQQEALGDVNASVVDRYFSGASACPKSVFSRLLKNARHHASKAKDETGKGGIAFLLERLIDTLADPFDPKNNGFPSSLSLENQGLFILGYHHMRKWLWMNKDERAAWEAEYPAAPRAYIWSADAKSVVTASK